MGDFGDLKMMIDLMAKTGQRVLQLLPINDTTITHTWTDSYPYSCISIFAIHPQYADLRALPELEDEEEEAAPVSDKRLKREMRAEAIRRLEEAARTEKDFRAVVEEWNKLDRNRERRERDHENLRGDVPLEYQAVPEPKLIPRWMNNPTYRQLMAGNFLDILFDCPYEMHNLTADAFVSRMVEELSEEHKEVLYFLSLRLYSTTRLAPASR